MAANDETGRTYPPWLVLSKAKSTEGTHTRARWLCACESGHRRTIRGSTLRRKPPPCIDCKNGVPPRERLAPAVTVPRNEPCPAPAPPPRQTRRERKETAEEARVVRRIEQLGIAEYLASIVKPTNADKRVLKGYSLQPGVPYRDHEEIIRFLARMSQE